jgi:MSHA biogenesis protein MshQ
MIRAAHLAAPSCRALLLAGSMTLTACGSDGIVDPVGPPVEGLLAYFAFTSDASDASGNGFHGTLLAGASASGALTLGASEDALSLPSTMLNGLEALTIGAWVRMDIVQAGTNQLVSGAIAADDNQVEFYYRSAEDRWEFDVDGTTSDFAANPIMEDGAWHHVTLTLGSGSARVYIDGVLIGEAIPTGAVVVNVDPGGLIIGQDQDTIGGDFDEQQSLAGQVDNLRIYGRALTASEVLLLATEAH